MFKRVRCILDGHLWPQEAAARIEAEGWSVTIRVCPRCGEMRESLYPEPCFVVEENGVRLEYPLQ